MGWCVLICSVLLCLSNLGTSRTLKRKRNAEIILADEPYDYYNTFGGSGEDNFHYSYTVALGFHVEYSKLFSDELLSPDSPAFKKEVSRVKRYMTEQIARNVGVISQDVTLDIHSFTPSLSPESTVADITVGVPGYFGITTDELRKAVVDIKDYGLINGNAITDISELAKGDSELPAESEDVIIDLELTYEYDISSGDIDLLTHGSDDFISEAVIVQQELTLHLVAKLADQGVFISPDQIKIDVLDFRSADSNTAVTLSVEASDISIVQLSEALNSLVIDDDVGINGRLVISIEELTRSEFGEYTDYPTTDEKVMSPEEPVPDEPEPNVLDEHDVLMEVMPDMGDKPFFEEEPPIEPDIIAVANPAEPTPPPPPEETEHEEPIPPFPGEFPDHCASIRKPERGSVSCDNENNIGSRCTFSCEYGTKLEGYDEIMCDHDGAWSAEAPYCIKIFCQPHHILLENGRVACTDHNAFASTCEFTCNERHTLKGSATTECQDDNTWTNELPTCEPDPVNCEDEYGPWLDCADGKRIKEAVLVPFDGSSVLCPEMQEVCIDCKIEWGEWGACSDGARSRSQFVAQTSVGAGAECTPLEFETEECMDCELGWGEWGECADGLRTRTQIILVNTFGAGAPCPPLKEESEVCVDCVLEWEEWSECQNGERGRAQIVKIPRQGAGKQCEEQLIEVEDCFDCEVGWGEWSECSNGIRTRTEVILLQPVGAGLECPELRTEREDCIDCVMEWGPWGECISGITERIQIIITRPVGAGKQCNDPEIEVKDCNLCEVLWGEWTPCTDGRRQREQYVFREPSGVDIPCPVLQTQEEVCVDCEVTWGEWSLCHDEIRERIQVVLTEPVGAGNDCPELQREVEPCVDCLVEWGPWSDCNGEERVRSEYVVFHSVGAGTACPELHDEREECQNCAVAWGEWGQCRNNERIRYEVIVTEQFGGGRPCPELRRDVQACLDCVVEWQPWSECEENERTRSQYVVVQPYGDGAPCPELQVEIEDCVDCIVEWGEWSECADEVRVRRQHIVEHAVGAGKQCQALKSETEACIDCQIEWGTWSQCRNGERVRSQYVRVAPVGVGMECLPLEEESEDCTNCEVEWGDWGICSDGQRAKSQFISVQPVGGGRPCGILQTRVEECVDCVVEWSPWSECFLGRRSRSQHVAVQLVGAGKECPPLESEVEECVNPNADEIMEDLVCRFTDRVLGYNRTPELRDLLLIGDESGSIGWVNFDKIKRNFKAVASSIRGGVGSQEAQIGMMSFARYSRTAFMFDDYDDVIDVNAAIDRTYYLGGYRSRIGSALTDANTWVFQQTGGMRSFPNIDDNIEHEILIATDGCRTSDVYMLKKGLEVIKKRGIKLYVLAIASKDIRCRETVQSMVEDSDDLFEVGDWKDLDKFTALLEKKSCVPRSRSDAGTEEEEEAAPLVLSEETE